MTVRNVLVLGQHQANTLDQLADVASRADRAALMADGHFGYIMPVGGVAAYKNQVSVAGVGFDIGCGNAAIRTDVKLSSEGAVREYFLNGLADDIQATISFGVGRTNRAKDAPVDHALFEEAAWDAIPGNHERDILRAKARSQLGTVGSGNHYVDVFVDEQEHVWVGVHFGSRGLGHTIATGVMALHQNQPWNTKVKETEALLPLDSALGDAYWNLMSLAGRYAYAGREWVARKVVEMLGGSELELVHNHHNFAWKEPQLLEGSWEELVVVRKGATPAWPNQKGFVGGSMGDDSVILQGTPVERQTDVTQKLREDALFSTVHGAGRVMSRTEAAGKRDRRTGRQKTVGKVTPEMMAAWLKRKGVVLRGGGLDESPHAYRRLDEVLKDQGDTIEVLHTLRPLVVVMAGANEYDPYKD